LHAFSYQPPYYDVMLCYYQIYHKGKYNTQKAKSVQGVSHKKEHYIQLQKCNKHLQSYTDAKISIHNMYNDTMNAGRIFGLNYRGF